MPLFSDWEIGNAVKYARSDRPHANYVGVLLDKNLLRAIANEVERRREPRVRLAPLAGVVCREFLRQRNVAEERLYEGYLCAIMKMYSDRSTRFRTKRAMQKRAREGGVKDATGQYLLPLPRPRGSVTRASKRG